MIKRSALRWTVLKSFPTSNGRCFSKGFECGRTEMDPCAVRLKYLTPIHRSAVGAALNSIVCLDCGVRGGVRVGDRPASLSGCSCGSSRRGMGEKIWLGGDGLFPVKQVVEQGVPRVFPGPVLG